MGIWWVMATISVQAHSEEAEAVGQQEASRHSPPPPVVLNLSSASVLPVTKPDMTALLPEDALLAAMVRVPLLSHGSLRCTCRRWRQVCGSASFLRQRRETGYAQSFVVVAGGTRHDAFLKVSTGKRKGGEARGMREGTHWRRRRFVFSWVV